MGRSDRRDAEGTRPELIAFRDSSWPAMRIVPAPRRREWMNATEERFANRCLPLLVANECGWVLLNPRAFRATWTGEDDPASVAVEFADGDVLADRMVKSHFGYGVITWRVPFLFRTPPGYNLLARGPANWPKDGICALEGIVETDWSVSTFTMNWKLTRPRMPVDFDVDEPFCMVVPQRRGEIESFDPQISDVDEDPATRAGLDRWFDERKRVLARQLLHRLAGEHDTLEKPWDSHYLKGSVPEGGKAATHQTRLRLAEFRVREPG